MFISSRTPEGSPNRCPVCGALVRLEPSVPFGDAPCPACGTLLWFLDCQSDVLFFEHEKSKFIQDRAAQAVSRRLGVPIEVVIENPDLLKNLELDSIELVELVMELEGGISD